LIDGTVFKSPSLCRQKKEKCIRFYQSLKDKKGFHVTPCGLTAYSFGHNQNLIFSGIRVEKNYNITKTKHYKSDFLPTLPKKIIIDFVRNHLDETGKAEVDTQLINSTLHEIRKFNTEIKRISEEILTSDRFNEEVFVKKVKTIFASSSLMSIRLNVFDFEENPEVITATGLHPLSLYKKFDKANHILEVYARNKKINIKIMGSSYNLVEAYPVIDFLPFVILENGIKYSPPNQDIVIKFSENNTDIDIVITSIGPTISDKEIDEVFSKGKRGHLAEKVENSGGGYGLYFAKIVCDLHNIEIKVERGQHRFTLDGISHSDFFVYLKYQAPSNHITMGFT